MRAYLPLALALAATLLGFVWWFLRTPPERVAKFLRRGAVILAVTVIVVLAATGRLHWVFAAVGATVALVLRLLRILPALPLPLLHRLFSSVLNRRAAASGPAPGQASTVETRFLRMQLDHDSGEMDGEVLLGRFAGRTLATLSGEELLALLGECRADEQSASVLEAYLDRMHPDWRDQAGTGSEGGAGSTDGDLTEHDALEILGLQPGASREEIIAAHRRLMQKLHPDHGGSDYLAARVNAARDLLLGE